MPVDRQIIEEKLAQLGQAIKLLEEYRGVPREDFLVDFTINSAARFNLVLGIEIIVDIGNHILSEVYQAHPKEYRDVLEALGAYDIVPQEFATENAKMAGFRNRVIHHYGEVDMKIVYQVLRDAPDIFREFAKAFAEFLDRSD